VEIEQLSSIFAGSPHTAAVAKLLENNRKTDIFLSGFVGSSAPMLFASLSLKTPRTILFVLNDAEEAGYFYHDLTQVMSANNVLFFPSAYKRAAKYGQKDPANEVLRTEVLARLTNTSQFAYIVTYPEAIAEKVASSQKVNESSIHLHVGDSVDIADLEKDLDSLGFELHDYVYEPGQYAIRGSIVDIFSFSSEYPYRIDFFGDEIDSIRTFDVVSQLSEEKTDSVVIVPPLDTTATEKVPLPASLPEGTILCVKDYGFVCDRIRQTYNEGFSKQSVDERLETAKESEYDSIMQEFDPKRQLVSAEEFDTLALPFRRITLGGAQKGKAAGGSTQNASVSVVKSKFTAQPLFHKNFDLLTESFSKLISQGYKLYILADSKKQQQRLRDIFDDIARTTHTEPIAFTAVDKTIHEGFSDDAMKICLFTDHQIFDRFHKFNLKSDKARSGKVALTLKEISELNVNDYIVHVDHGIGRFDGLVRVPQGDGYQEMVRLVYQNNDVVYVSIHSLYKISKYRGKDGEPPKMSRLGTGAWQKMKERTKKKIKDIARDLIRLYSQRRKEKGFQFSPDTYLQHELEASFIYEDTPDQLKATNDVKADMERARPMDRLVCGDVGFGKTEVAVRAAFKAATDGKQTAVLVPTTVLAFQHYKTFQSRLKDFPVRVDYLSRARSSQKTKQILQDLQDGKIDIIIGTHKLIGKSVKFKDLGLLIIDEEQKFGVAVKEKLRQIKTSVDTLTMSATPIPRTLQFSLMGARDMSVIQTPPPNRYPIQTEVHTFNKDVIRDAINFEMSRNGQVFFVTNRISSLPELKTIINEAVPDARVAVGHGQMKPEELEDVIMGFINYDYDVLLSTTIVENGIDIPNANTIIINQAQRFGLSDLHQMRGRVGRSNRKAFCFLLAPPLNDLSPDARRRLEAIENFSGLGSGIHLAMQDLDIRGAGNLLGSEQSGFIADLGYETYQKILSQAVTELKNDEFSDLYADTDKKELKGDMFVDDCQLESDLEMYFPDSFVPNSSERIILYRQLDNIERDEDLETFKSNLIDRFGKIPPEAEELMRVVILRRLGRQTGIERIVLKGGRMSLYFVSNQDSPFYQSDIFGRVLAYLQTHPTACNLHEKNGKCFMTVKNVPTVAAALDILRAMQPVAQEKSL